MKTKKRPSTGTVLICIFVFLCIFGIWFFAFRTEFGSGQLEKDRKNEQAEIGTEQAEHPQDEKFIRKNQEQMEKLKEVQDNLVTALPKLGMTSQTFNENLQPLITLLQNVDESLAINWEQFQTDFAYEYEKLNKDKEYRAKLPKNIQETEEQIIKILQELNEIIQQMNK